MIKSAIQYCWVLVLMLAGCNLSNKPARQYQIKFEILPGASEQDIQSTVAVLTNRLRLYTGDDYLSLARKNNYILISVASSDSISGIAKMLTAPGKLQLLETYSAPEFYSYLQVADSIIDKQLKEKKGVQRPASNLDSAIDASNKHPLFSVLSVPVFDKNGMNKIFQGPVIAYVLSKDTGIVNKYLNNPAFKSLFPANVRFMLSANPMESNRNVFCVYAVHPPSFADSAFSCDFIKKINWSFDDADTHVPEINMEMNEDGSFFWKRLTTRNTDKSIAIVIDGRVYSAPKVKAPINNGKLTITGSFTVEEAKDLVYIIKGGMLEHIPIKLVEIK